MGEIDPGLYEALVTDHLRRALRDLPAERAHLSRLQPAEVPDRIAWHLGRVLERALADVGDSTRVTTGIAVARALVALLDEHLAVDGLPGDQPDDTGEVLRAVYALGPDGRPAPIGEPLIPLLDTTLLTNAPGEPSLWSQLASEIASADRIDVVMAFIRRSGITPLAEALRRHVAGGRGLRVLTTTYTGSTQRVALDDLRDLGARIRISYDIGSTRLHAKSWVFHRASGYSTAYVGSSNLTHTAQATGLEWNVRLSAARNRDAVAKVMAVFDSYWDNGDFVDYEPLEFDRELERAAGRDRGPLVILSPIELQLRPFQDRLLELIDLSRTRGHHRNLLVAATGTGKTVMAAVDYARLRARLPRSRLLFVAHREEILDQSLATFRHVLRDASFGEKWVGGARPTHFDHVFASVQSLAATGLDALSPNHFDVVVIDEFHHAAAPSYSRLLDHLTPVELLGLTATPERSDGLPVLHWFGDRIAAELRLWDAIDQQHLVPFAYYGIHDGMDLSRIPWRRGAGYDTTALTAAYTSSQAWARLVVQQVRDHVDVGSMRCLGFCVSVEHARFMAAQFRRHGISSVAVWGDSPREEREAALRDLASGNVQAVFSVDLFNEGVDVPAVDVVLMLRPTESPTLFLQQLGRGLRRASGKSVCTVLDFVGNHRREFRYDRRLCALLGGSRRKVAEAVSRGFPYLPAGCAMQLDRMSSQIILRSLREALPSRWPAKVEELRSLRRLDPGIELAGFLRESGLDLDDVYGKGWSQLQQDAGAMVAPPGPHEGTLRRAVGRLRHVDDVRRTAGWRELLEAAVPPDVAALDEGRRRLLHMLVAQVADRALDKEVGLPEGTALLWAHGQVRAEIRQLLDVLDARIDHVGLPLATHPDAPLTVHARYTRLEILTAMGLAPRAKVAAWQSGVYEARAARAELFAFTLDKTGDSFSPTTRYRDYAISRTLIHWESQAATREDSPTGRRYRNHERDGRSILLFCRLRADDRAFWFLGPATYRGHEGERPMAITWELHHPLPGDLYASFAAAVA